MYNVITNSMYIHVPPTNSIINNFFGVKEVLLQWIMEMKTYKSQSSYLLPKQDTQYSVDYTYTMIENYTNLLYSI